MRDYWALVVPLARLQTSLLLEPSLKPVTLPVSLFSLPWCCCRVTEAHDAALQSAKQAMTVAKQQQQLQDEVWKGEPWAEGALCLT